MGGAQEYRGLGDVYEGPALGRAGLAAEVAEAVAGAHRALLRDRGEPRVAVSAPPDQIDAIKDALDQAGL